MKALLILVFLSFTVLAEAQTELPAGYNKKNRLDPDSTLHISSLSRYFNSIHKNQDEKLMAIYQWVTMTIHYNSDSVYHINSYADPYAKISSALRRKKGVCENFAAIFTELSNQCGIKSVSIPGYTKQGGRIDRAGHAWVATFLNGNWFLSDPTWDAGRSNPNYYLVSPNSFIYSHMPFDPLWQLIDEPVSNRSFINGGISVNESPKSNERINERVAEYLSLNELDQLNAAEKRMNKEGPLNDLIRNEMARTKMDIEVLHENRDIELYNSAAEDLNKAKRIFNQFIQYRNNEFRPAKPIDEISSMLKPVRSFINSSESKLTDLKKSKASLTLDHSFLEDEVSKLKKKLEGQLSFIAEYFASNPLILKNQ